MLIVLSDDTNSGMLQNRRERIMALEGLKRFSYVGGWNQESANHPRKGSK